MVAVRVPAEKENTFVDVRARTIWLFWHFTTAMEIHEFSPKFEYLKIGATALAKVVYNSTRVGKYNIEHKSMNGNAAGE